MHAGLHGGLPHLRQARAHHLVARHQHLHLPPPLCNARGLLELRCKVSMPRQGTQRGAGAGGEEELEQMYLATLQDFLHSKTCVLPPDTFALRWPTGGAAAGYWPAAEALSSQESGVSLFRGASTPGHPVTAVRPRVEAGEADTRLLATARHRQRHTGRLEHEQIRCDK